MAMKIQQLNPGVVKRLRSGIAFMSVAQCVEELVLNSIDAEATCIAVNLNLPVYQIQVIDNGCGITAEQMNIIGTRYATSKCHTLEDLQNLKSGGFRGEALASLKEISSVLMIESRATSSSDTYCKIFTQGKALDPKKSLNSRPSRGTTVTVYDFMYNLPVRKMSICEALDVEECRKLLQSIALMYLNISFTIQNEATGEMYLQLRKCSSLYHSFFQMFGKNKAQNLKTIDYQTDNYEINGCISTDCHISKDLQFLYVNKRRMLRTKLHKLINSILNKVLSSRQKSNISSSSSISETSSPLKNQSYCIFVINILCPYDKYDIIFEPRKTMIEFSDWDSVLKVVEEALNDFLKRENLSSNVNEAELNVTNAKDKGNAASSIFDVQDVHQGLFSHVARRLKMLKSNEHSVNEIKSQNSVRNELYETPVMNISSKYLNRNERTLSNESKVPNSRNNIESSDPGNGINLRCINSSISLPSNLSTDIDKNTSKGGCETGIPSLPETDFDIPCRSVFPSENPIMLRVPSKSVLSNLQASSSNSKIIHMQEKMQCFVRKENSNNKVQGKFDKELLPLAEPSSNESLKNSSALCINKKKYENKLNHMINKSSQCPSVSNVSKSFTNIGNDVSSDHCITVETKDESLQCPSVKSKNQAQVKSRFQFKEESHTLLQNLKKYRRIQKDSSKELQTKSIVSSDNYACSTNDNNVHKSKKFKSFHFTKDSEIAIEVLETRTPEEDITNMETEINSEIYHHPAVSVPDDIELFSYSPRKVHNPNLNPPKIDFNKFRSSFDLKTFAKTQKPKLSVNKRPIFNDFRERFQKEKITYQSERNFDDNTSEEEVNTYQDPFPDIMTDNILHATKKTEESCYLKDFSQSSVFKENTGPILSEKVPIESKIFNENNITDDNILNFNLNDLTPTSNDVYSVVHNLIFNAAELSNTSRSQSPMFYQNKKIDESIAYSNASNNKACELFSNNSSDVLTTFGKKSISCNVKCDAVCFKKVATDPPKDLDLSLMNDNVCTSSVLPACNNNFESNPIIQNVSAVCNSAIPFNVKLNQSQSDIIGETSSMLERSDSNCESDCFTEKLFSVPGNDITKASTSLDNLDPNRNASILEKRSNNDIEFGSGCFSAIPDNNSTSVTCTKLNKSDNGSISASEVKLDYIEFKSDPFTEKLSLIPDNSLMLESDPFTEKLSSVPDNNSLILESDPFTEKLSSVSDNNSLLFSKIKSPETFPDENNEISSDFIIKSTAEIELESETLNKKLSTLGKSSLNGDHAEENNVNEDIPSNSSQELFTEVPLFKLPKKLEVSNNQQQNSKASEILSTSKDVGSVQTGKESHEISKLEITHKTSTEDTFTGYNHLRLNSQPECKRNIYIDSVTGNSSYVVPDRNEIQENKFIDVNNGFLKKSHFFLTHDYSPFVSKTQTPNKLKNDNCNIQNDLMEYVKENEKSRHCDKWRNCQGGLNYDENIEKMLIAWDNPAFDIPYEVSSVGDDKITQSVSQMHVFLNSYRFSKNSLNSLQVIGQVDCKFIACILKDFNQNCRDQRLLALFDQHAVHERIRLEELMEDLYELGTDDEKCVKTSIIDPPLEISLSDDQIRLLQVYHEKLHKIGIHLKIDNNSHVSSVLSVPLCLVHKETGELRRSTSDTVTILQNSITEWLSAVVKTRSIPQVLPKTLTSVLNYQACRSAVKFGDPLTLEQCCDLMKSLLSCKLPFQCAHGRPSVAPILDLKKIEALYKKRPPPQLQKLLGSPKNS